MRFQDEKLRDLIAEQAAEWHVAQLDGGLSPQQSRAFMQWLRTSPVHVAEYLTIAGIAKDVSDVARASTTSLQDVLAEDDESVRLLHLNTGKEASTPELPSPQAHHSLQSRSAHSHHAPRRSSFRLAAALAAVFIVSIALMLGLYRFASKPDIRTFATRHGEARSLQLPDNTLVRLDSDSAITVNFDDHSRRVTLERGQAYFKVATDPTRLFSVRVDQSLIRDIGTAFDVYRHHAGTTITVAEGRVQVWHAPLSAKSMSTRWLPWAKSGRPVQGQPIVTLDAGEQALVSASGQVESRGTADLRQTLAWTQGNIVFDNRPVATVAAEFNRYNNAQISIEDARIGALPISGTFNAHDVTTFVAFLGSIPGVRVETRDQHVFVYADREKRRHRE